MGFALSILVVALEDLKLFRSNKRFESVSGIFSSYFPNPSNKRTQKAFKEVF